MQSEIPERTEAKQTDSGNKASKANKHSDIQQAETQKPLKIQDRLIDSEDCSSQANKQSDIQQSEIQQPIKVQDQPINSGHELLNGLLKIASDPKISGAIAQIISGNINI